MSDLLLTGRAVARKAALLGGVLASCLVLAACDGGAGAARSNPNSFTVDVRDGKMTGIYNPAGFDSKKVQKLLAANCPNRKLGSYGEQAKDGLIAFTATC